MRTPPAPTAKALVETALQCRVKCRASVEAVSSRASFLQGKLRGRPDRSDATFGLGGAFSLD